ncbi:hypothetical protein QL285_077428 [Trifolium repens]|nr:hypothetical protein QL285_077428 [Trifolium repens]
MNWVVPQILQNHYPQLQHIINQIDIPLMPKEDEFIWNHTVSGCLSLKDAFLHLSPDGQHLGWSKLIWQAAIPPARIWSWFRNLINTHFIISSCDDLWNLCNRGWGPQCQGRGRGNGGNSSNQGGNRKHGFPPNYGKSFAANNTSLDPTEDKEDVDDAKSVRGQSNTDTFGFTKEQYNHLVSLIHASSSKVNIASGHVTSGKEEFEDDWFG